MRSDALKASLKHRKIEPHILGNNYYQDSITMVVYSNVFESLFLFSDTAGHPLSPADSLWIYRVIKISVVVQKNRQLLTFAVISSLFVSFSMANFATLCTKGIYAYLLVTLNILDF